MKAILILVLVAAALLAGARQSSARPLRGFVTLGVMSDLNDQHFPTIGGGIVLDLINSWVSVGGQGDVLFSNGYAAGRGGPIAQANIVRRQRFRLFAIGGLIWGEEAGPMFGAGLEMWSKGPIGFRVSVEDYLAQVAGFDCGFYGFSQSYCDANLHGGRSYIGHQPSARFGISWR